MEGSGFHFKFIEKGVRVVGVMRGGSGQDPSWLLWQSLAPGWWEGLTPHTGPLTLTKLRMDQASGTALPPHTLTRRDT